MCVAGVVPHGATPTALKAFKLLNYMYLLIHCVCVEGGTYACHDMYVEVGEQLVGVSSLPHR